MRVVADDEVDATVGQQRVRDRALLRGGRLPVLLPPVQARHDELRPGLAGGRRLRPQVARVEQLDPPRSTAWFEAVEQVSKLAVARASASWEGAEKRGKPDRPALSPCGSSTSPSRTLPARARSIDDAMWWRDDGTATEAATRDGPDDSGAAPTVAPRPALRPNSQAPTR